MSKIRCSFSFHTSKVDYFPVFAGGVRDGIFGNPQTFAMPPLALPGFQARLDNYNNKRYAYEQGGMAQRGPYREAKADLMEALDTLVPYVDSVADGNVNIVTLAGYVPTKGGKSKAVKPDDPTGVQLTRGAKGVLLAECDNQNKQAHFGCILTANNPLPDNIILNDSGQLQILDEQEGNNKEVQLAAASIMVTALLDLNPGRKKQFINLQPGVTYYVVFYASNSAGVSGFSGTVSIMCA